VSEMLGHTQVGITSTCTYTSRPAMHETATSTLGLLLSEPDRPESGRPDTGRSLR
jgi:hypothetical protein